MEQYCNNISGATTTDSAGTVYFVASTTYHGSNFCHDAEYYVPNAAFGTHKVNVTFSGSTLFGHVYVSEYSGLATTTPLTASSIQTGGASGPVTSPAMTLSVANEMALGVGDSAGDTLSSISGFTQRATSPISEDNATGTQLAAGATVSTTFNGYAGSDWSDIGSLWEPPQVFIPTATNANSNTFASLGNGVLNVQGSTFQVNKASLNIQ